MSKKFYLIIFLHASAFAGRIFTGDPSEEVYEFQRKLYWIRTQIDTASIAQAEKLLQEFDTLLQDFKRVKFIIKKDLKKYGSDRQRKLYSETAQEINKDKILYQSLRNFARSRLALEERE